jgi:hypothetical protein
MFQQTQAYSRYPALYLKEKSGILKLSHSGFADVILGGYG